jgi:hypothetical protein
MLYPQRGAHTSQLRFTVGGAEVVTFASDELRAALLEGVEGVAPEAPTNPVVMSLTITVRNGGTIQFSARTDVVETGLDPEVAAEDFAAVLNERGRPIEGSLTHTPGTRSLLQAWAWSAAAATEVDVNLAWTDLDKLRS